jgi:hypothetical protein
MKEININKNYNKVGFEKAFKKAVTNFDETKIFFSHKSKMYEPSMIEFVLDGKLKKLPMYKTQYNIEIWKNYFIEFLNTGKFDYNAYWKLYENNSINPEDINKIYKFPLCNTRGNEFYEHSNEVSEFLSNYRKKYKNCGIKQVPKPLNIN